MNWEDRIPASVLVATLEKACLSSFSCINIGILVPLKCGSPAGMIKMKMTHDHSLDILDIVARFSDGRLQFMVWAVVDTRKDIINRRAPDLGVGFTGSGLKEDQTVQTFRRMVDKHRDKYYLSSWTRWVRIARARKTSRHKVSGHSVI